MATEYQPPFDKIIHERSRLAILAFLSSKEGPQAAFTELKEKLELTAGNLSVQLRNLEEAGYVGITKSFVENKPNTSVRLTGLGAQAFKTYLSQMESLINALKSSGPAS
ncbi:MAG TPA: transcriptional regulator [Spirochaetia bacterium]|nr:transcriptional regulator [Spirochaetia bacterium]